MNSYLVEMNYNTDIIDESLFDSLSLIPSLDGIVTREDSIDVCFRILIDETLASTTELARIEIASFILDLGFKLHSIESLDVTKIT